MTHNKRLLIFSSTTALSASNAAISSMMSCGLRWVTASPPLGFFTDRSKLVLSMSAMSTLHDLSESAKSLLQFDKFGKVGIVKRVGLAKVAAWVKLVNTRFLRVGAPFSKNSHQVFTPAPWNVPPGQSRTVWSLQFSNNSLRKLTEALSVLDRNVFLMTTPPRPPALSI